MDERELLKSLGGSNKMIDLGELLIKASGRSSKGNQAVSAAPFANANAGAVFGSAMTAATDTDRYDALVQNILKQSAVAFAPTLSQGLGSSGLYNNTALQLMQNDARAQAVGQSVAAITKSKQEALNTAALISNAQMQNNKAAQDQKFDKPELGDLLKSAAPTILAGVISKNLISGLSSLLKGDKKDPAEAGIGTTTAAPDSSDAGLGAASQFINSMFSTSGDVFGNTGAAATGASFGSVRTGDSSAADYSPISDVLSAAVNIGSALLGGGSGVSVDASSNSKSDPVGIKFNIPLGGPGSPSPAPITGGWVICTEFKHGGELSDSIYRKASVHFMSLPEDVVNGYHLWAIPYTRLMRKYRWARKLMLPIARGRARHVTGDHNFLGWLTVVLAEPLCALLGKLFVREAKNWQKLYSKG